VVANTLLLVVSACFDVHGFGPTPANASLEKGIIYVQPSFHFANTLLLDIEVLKTDLDHIAAGGFVNVGLRVSWGELMSSWDSATHTATFNEASCTKLGDVAAELLKRKLRLIVNTHLLDTVPQGVEGATFVNQSSVVDANGVHGPVRVCRQKSTLEDAIGSHAFSLDASKRVTNGILRGRPLLLPVHPVNYDQTL
jgi:hypothetical protein